MANLVLQNNAATTSTDLTFKVKDKIDWKIQNNNGTFIINGNSKNYIQVSENSSYTSTIMSTGLSVCGRAYGSGDDEGIVVLPASNGYAGISLGSNGGARTTLYLLPSTQTHRSVWRYNNGSASYNITHPETNGEVVVHTADTKQGDTNHPVYVADSGVVTPLSENVGGASQPVYLKAGVITAVPSVGVAYGGTG